MNNGQGYAEKIIWIESLPAWEGINKICILLSRHRLGQCVLRMHLGTRYTTPPKLMSLRFFTVPDVLLFQCKSSKTLPG